MVNYKLFYILSILFILNILIFIPSSKIYAASLFINYVNNPIISPSSNSFDSNATLASSVIFEDGNYKMWYVGNNGIKSEIGYATSNDGINWNKFNNNPVIKIDNNEIHLGTPKVIKDNNIYKMWYMSITGTGYNYYIAYATSSDGINWTKHGNINLPVQSWEGGARAYPFVLKSDNGYKMWYTSNDGHWRISYATSDDGINWTPYINNPVIVPTESWEGGEVDGAHVQYNNGLYEMFYHGSTNSISYATSNDGINWTKPADKNPVITSSIWGSQNMYAAFALKLNNGTTYLYFSGHGNDNKIRIGLATDGPLLPIATPTATPTSTPMPTNTPTPTPTKTPTPSPTPTLIVSNKVVVIPGFGGSWNRDALGMCLTDGYNTPWTSWEAADQIYNPFIHALEDNGFTPYLFNYDWRKTPPELADVLASFIAENTNPNEKVNIVGHSMGGLVARAYIEKYKENSKVAKLLTAGTPHAGATNAYPAWAGGDTWGDISAKSGAIVVKSICRLSHTFLMTNTQLYRKYLPSIQTFLPTFDYIYRDKTKIIKPVTTMIYQNPWLGKTSNFTYPFWGITVGTVSGKDKATPYKLGTIEPLKIDILRDEWADGRAFENMQLRKKEGDSLVLNQSSTLPGADNRFVSTDHGGTIRSPQAIQEIIQFLSGNNTLRVSNVPNYEINTNKEGLIIVATEGEISVTSNDGKKKLNSNNGVLYFENPGYKPYTTFFSNPKTKVYIFRTLLSGELENNYDLSKLNKQKFILNFNNKSIPLQ